MLITQNQFYRKAPHLVNAGTQFSILFFFHFCFIGLATDKQNIHGWLYLSQAQLAIGDEAEALKSALKGNRVKKMIIGQILYHRHVLVCVSHSTALFLCTVLGWVFGRKEQWCNDQC